MKEGEIVANQVQLILKAADIIHSRIKQIESNPKGLSITAAESVKKVYFMRSLKVYEDTLRYLASEIILPDTTKHIFLLPHVRTLMNIQANFLHLMINSSDEERMIMTCIAQQLLSLKLINNNEEYKKLLSTYQSINLFTSYKILFPSELEDFSKNWVKNNKFLFSTTDLLLTEKNIKRYSVDTANIFGAKESYRMFSFLSELLHANPYYNRKPYRERFWVISISLIISTYLIELIDRHILDKGQTRDFRDLLKEIQQHKKEFITHWKSTDQLAA